jgi:hypothetical protein
MNTKEKVAQIIDMQEEKAYRYGNVDQKMQLAMKALYPEGIPSDGYRDGLYVIHILEKLARIANPNIDFNSKLDAKKDVAGYSILAIEKDTNLDKQSK